MAIEWNEGGGRERREDLSRFGHFKGSTRRGKTKREGPRLGLDYRCSAAVQQLIFCLLKRGKPLLESSDHQIIISLPSKRVCRDRLPLPFRRLDSIFDRRLVPSGWL